MVRWGRKGEKVLLLNEQEVEVDDSVLCITDDSGVIGLGGIMGGESTKADEATRNVFLESAFFYPEAIAGRARRYNFTSDASHRFERGVDFDNNVDGIERATQADPRHLRRRAWPDGRPRRAAAQAQARRDARRARAEGDRHSGAGKEMASAFSTAWVFRTKAKSGSFTVLPPSFRFDIAIEEDLIEEVARLYGFERIAAHPPRVAATMLPVPEGKRSLHVLRERLVAADYREVINFSFVEPGWELGFRRRSESDPPPESRSPASNP